MIDEAHRLRNVYKPTNKIGNAIKQAIAPYKKILLTATPLQNSLLEIYGLVSIIDEFAFGDLKTYKARFTRLGENEDFDELKERLRPICKRTLRKQVMEYIKYTERHAIVQEFEPSDGEQRLYDMVTEYLQNETLYALPASQRSLMTLILRKLLASSTCAISDTLKGLSLKLAEATVNATAVLEIPEQVRENLEEFDEIADEWSSESDEISDDSPNEVRERKKGFNSGDVSSMKQEMERLQAFHELAKSITKNSKGEVRVYKLDQSNFNAWNSSVEHDPGKVERQLDLHIDHIRDNRTPEDILYELLLKSGFPLTTPVEQQTIEGKTVYSIAGGALMICLDGDLTLELIRAIGSAGASPSRCASPVRRNKS